MESACTRTRFGLSAITGKGHAAGKKGVSKAMSDHSVLREETAWRRRARGEGRIYRRGRIWRIQYYRNGRRVFESSRSENERTAQNLLRQRLGQVAAGIAPVPHAHRISYENLRDALLADYVANKRKWLRTGKDGKPYVCGLSTLNAFFKGFRAVYITADSLRAFIRNRQEKGAANGTINRSLALLRRMFHLATADGKLREVPHFPMLKEAPPRKGFLEHANYQKLRQKLPEHLRPVLSMGYHTGMRLGEILKLRWPCVDLAKAEISLDPGTTKNDQPRTIPLAGDGRGPQTPLRRRFAYEAGVRRRSRLGRASCTVHSLFRSK